jgi:hypothetical protein
MVRFAGFAMVVNPWSSLRVEWVLWFYHDQCYFPIGQAQHVTNFRKSVA